MAFPANYDTEEIREEARRTGSRQLKREWIKKGYTEQLSLYGAVYKPEADAFERRRIEVLSDRPWIRETLKAVADSFDEQLPHFPYSIWILSNKQMHLQLVGGYD